MDHPKPLSPERASRFFPLERQIRLNQLQLTPCMASRTTAAWSGSTPTSLRPTTRLEGEAPAGAPD